MPYDGSISESKEENKEPKNILEGITGKNTIKDKINSLKSGANKIYLPDALGKAQDFYCPPAKKGRNA